MSAVLEVREPDARYLAVAELPSVKHFELLSTAHGAIGRLRELLLTLAVQGRLVKQIPGEEPATALLARIREAKGMSLGGSEEQDSEGRLPFRLPAGWACSKFGDYVLELCTGPFGSLIHKEDYVVGGVPLINPSHMVNHRIVPDDSVSLSPAMAASLDAYRLRAGDVLLARRGEVGRYALVTEREDGWLCGTGSFFAKLTPECDRRFFGLLLDDPRLRRYLQGESVGTTMTNLNQRILLNAVFGVPPLAEQARIVARVDELMRLCDALEAKGRLEAEQHARLLDTLLGTLTDSATPEELAANWQRVATHFDLLLDRPEAVDALDTTLIRLALRGLLGAPAASVGSSDWTVSSIGAIASVVTDGTHKTPTYVGSGVKFVSAKDVRSGRLSFDACKYISREEHEQLSRRCRPERGDILISKSGSIGTVVLVDVDEEFSLFESLALVKFEPARMDGEFFRLALQNACNTLEEGDIKGVAVKHLHLNVLRGLKVPAPPIEEQRCIVARVTELRRLCANLRERLAAQQTVQSHLADALVEQALA